MVLLKSFILAAIISSITPLPYHHQGYRFPHRTLFDYFSGPQPDYFEYPDHPPSHPSHQPDDGSWNTGHHPSHQPDDGSWNSGHYPSHPPDDGSWNSGHHPSHKNPPTHPWNKPHIWTTTKKPEIDFYSTQYPVGHPQHNHPPGHIWHRPELWSTTMKPDRNPFLEPPKRKPVVTGNTPNQDKNQGTYNGNENKNPKEPQIPQRHPVVTLKPPRGTTIIPDNVPVIIMNQDIEGFSNGNEKKDPKDPLIPTVGTMKPLPDLLGVKPIVVTNTPVAVTNIEKEFDNKGSTNENKGPKEPTMPLNPQIVTMKPENNSLLDLLGVKPIVPTNTSVVVINHDKGSDNKGSNNGNENEGPKKPLIPVNPPVVIIHHTDLTSDSQESGDASTNSATLPFIPLNSPIVIIDHDGVGVDNVKTLTKSVFDGFIARKTFDIESFVNSIKEDNKEVNVNQIEKQFEVGSPELNKILEKYPYLSVLNVDNRRTDISLEEKALIGSLTNDNDKPNASPDIILSIGGVPNTPFVNDLIIGNEKSAIDIKTLQRDIKEADGKSIVDEITKQNEGSEVNTEEFNLNSSSTPEIDTLEATLSKDTIQTTLKDVKDLDGDSIKRETIPEKKISGSVTDGLQNVFHFEEVVSNSNDTTKRNVQKKDGLVNAINTGVFNSSLVLLPSSTNGLHNLENIDPAELEKIEKEIAGYISSGLVTYYQNQLSGEGTTESLNKNKDEDMKNKVNCDLVDISDPFAIDIRFDKCRNKNKKN